jgi:superfamily II DNA or RNA helicase
MKCHATRRSKRSFAPAGWDLVVFDEAHKLAAHFFGNKLEITGRFRLAEKIGAQTRHLLLMTATPHSAFFTHIGAKLWLPGSQVVFVEPTAAPETSSNSHPD